MDDLSRLPESVRKLALDRLRLLQPHLEQHRSLRAIALGHHRASVLSSAIWTTSTPTTSHISRLNHTARPLAVYASQSGLPHRPRKTRFRMAGQPFPGGTHYPPRPNERSQLFHSPFPGFAWRTQIAGTIPRQIIRKVKNLAFSAFGSLSVCNNTWRVRSVREVSLAEFNPGRVPSYCSRRFLR